MTKYLHSELSMAICVNSNSVNEVQNKFLDIFQSDPLFRFFNSLFLFKGPATQHIEKDNLDIFIHGEIYEGFDIIDSLPYYFKQKDERSEKLSQINGSFVILIIDKHSREIFIITDRVNTRRIYLCINRDVLFLTTSPDHFKCIDNEVNVGAVACYLINGVVYNNNTLYRNINALERASFYKIVNGKITGESYWNYSFTNEYSGISKVELKKKFGELLIKSVSRRIHSLNPNTCFISLSGGYDSRFLLGALRLLQSNYKLKTFSYGMVEKRELGDDIIAKQLAEKFGFEHHFEPAYSNDLLKTISLNVKYGYGYSNFCDEADAWLNLSNLFSEDPSSLLFVGDMFHHSSFDIKHVKNKRLPLSTVIVLPVDYIKPFLAKLPKSERESLISGYEEMYQQIMQKLPDTNKYKIIKDFAYLDQRISHTLVYWREFFHGPFIKVTQPLLDNDVLDFHRRLPEEMRHNKSLYKETLHELFPDLFQVPIAKNIWAYPSWSNEITNHRAEILLKLNEKSLLDGIIPPETIQTLIDNLSNAPSGLNNTIRVLRKISGMNDSMNDLFGSLALKITHIDQTKLIIRLLVLREALKALK